MSRLIGLDALRGVAALCVAYSHLIAKMKRDGQLDEMGAQLFLVSKAVLDVGKVSVLVLFALSGYFVMAALYKSRGRYAANHGVRLSALLPALSAVLAVADPRGDVSLG